MKLPKHALIECLCPKANGSRDSLSLPFLDTSGATPMLIATDGKALAAIDVEADKDEHGYVPIPALKHARKLGAKNLPANIALNSVCVCDDGAQLPRTIPPSWKFPEQWRQTIPHDAPVIRLALNPQLLAKLADALGSSEHVILEITAGHKPKDEDRASGPIRVLPMGGKGFGAIMRIPVAQNGATP